MKLMPSSIKKKSVFLKLGSLLPQGENEAGQWKNLAEALSFLNGLEKQGLLTTYLVAGQEKQAAWKKISGLGLEKFFAPQNMFFVTKDYIDSKEEVDRERHLAALEKDPLFVDEYFTQMTILALISSGKAKKEESVLLGNDIWFDGFYTARFSSIDFVLVEEKLSERNELLVSKLSGLNYVSISANDFKKIVLWNFPQNDVAFLQRHVMDTLSKEILKDTDFSGLRKKLAG